MLHTQGQERWLIGVFHYGHHVRLDWFDPDQSSFTCSLVVREEDQEMNNAKAVTKTKIQDILTR